MKSLAAALKKFEEQFNISFDDLPLDSSMLPPPSCSVCGDTGYITYDVPLGDPRFGKMFKCINPTCLALQRIVSDQVGRVMNFSSWQGSYNDWSFESFKTLMKERRWEGKRGAFAAAAAFAMFQRPFTLDEAAQAAWGNPWKGLVDKRESQSLVLTGAVGKGKTGLAVAAVNALRLRNQPVIFIRVQELIRRLQETYADNWQGETADTRVAFYSSVPYLVIDEFGVKDFTTNRLELIESIIRERDRRGLAFMATTNMSKDEFYASWQPQIADIVAKAHWVEVSGVKLRETAVETATW